MTVAPMVRGHEVIITKVGGNGGGNGLFADIAVRRAFYCALFKQRRGLFFKSPNTAHGGINGFRRLR